MWWTEAPERVSPEARTLSWTWRPCMPRAAVARQQRGVDVEDAPGVGGQCGRVDLLHVASGDDQADVTLACMGQGAGGAVVALMTRAMVNALSGWSAAVVRARRLLPVCEARTATLSDMVCIMAGRQLSGRRTLLVDGWSADVVGVVDAQDGVEVGDGGGDGDVDDPPVGEVGRPADRVRVGAGGGED